MPVVSDETLEGVFVTSGMWGEPLVVAADAFGIHNAGENQSAKRTTYKRSSKCR